MTDSTITQRQQAFVKRREATGQKRFQFWATAEEKDFLKDQLDLYRKGVTVKPEFKQINTAKEAFIKDLKNGFFMQPFEKSRPYVSDGPWFDNPSVWNKRLPDGLLVFADHRKRVKEWRAVKLIGLGSFPVIWALLFALKETYWSRVHGGTKSINFVKFDVQSDLITLVGKAKMRIDSSFVDTPLGFMTHSIDVKVTTVSSNILDEFPIGVLTIVVDKEKRLLGTNAVCQDIEQILAWMEVEPQLKGNWHITIKALISFFLATNS